MSIIEWIATFFGLACVLFYIRQNVWSWPTGLIQVCLYTVIFYQARLYSDFLLQWVYIVLQIYGWYHWAKPRPNARELPITRLTRRAAAIWLIAAVGTTAGWGYLMRHHTDAAYPYWDAAIAVLSLVAQYLIAQKVLENWLIWIGVDILAIGVYWAKGLRPTTGLYSVFLLLAIAGWLEWRKTYIRTVG